MSSNGSKGEISLERCTSVLLQHRGGNLEPISIVLPLLIWRLFYTRLLNLGVSMLLILVLQDIAKSNGRKRQWTMVNGVAPSR
jgi:hypothetical protein